MKGAIVSVMDGSAFAGDERYTIVRRIGAGGFGVVYEAIDGMSGERVALKTLRDVQPESLYRLKREFRALVDVEHPNLVSLYELAVTDDEWFFTMELIDGVDFLEAASSAGSPSAPTRDVTPVGGSSRSSPEMETGRVDVEQLTMPVATALASDRAAPRLRQRPFADPARLRPLLRELAEGVAALHRYGMLHRDLKPSNVLVSRGGRVVILDFGLVEETRQRSLNPQLLGTIEYMSPEQAAGEPATTASDWYSVGIILFEALSGRLPFDGALVDLVSRKVSEDPPDIASLVDGVPDDLATLCTRLLAREPDQRPDAAAILAVLGGDAKEVAVPASAEADVGLVGRDVELDALARAAARSRDGTAVVVALHGPPGIGKTALLDDFLARLATSGSSRRALILRGRCYERESVPYKAIDSVIDVLGRELRGRELSGASLRDLLPSAIKTLARLFPVLRRVGAIERSQEEEGDAKLDPDELRQRGFTALRELLWALAREAPLVLCIDDLHWGDRDSAALLASLLAAPSPPPLLLLASYRDDVVGSGDAPCVELLGERLRPRADLERRELVLGRLSDSTAEELARRFLAGSGRESEAVALARQAEALPLNIVELSRVLRVFGDGSSGSVDLDARGSLVSLLGACVVDLEGPTRALLEVLVIAGKPVLSGLALRAAELREGGRAAVAELRRQHLIRADGKRLEPAHEWVRTAVLRDLEADREISLHRRLAEAYAEEELVDVDALAVHYAAAGELQRAASFAVTAAERAALALAFDRAVELYRTAMLGEVEGRRRAMILAALGEALVSAGRGGEAAEAFLGAAEWSATEGMDPDRALDLRRRAGFELLRSGHVDEGVGVLQRVLEEVGMRLADRPWRAIASLLRHRLALRLRGLGFRERPIALQDAELLRRADVAWSIGASGLGMVDDLAAGEFQSLALRLALRSGEPSRVLRALAGEIAFSAVRGSANERRTASLLHTARTLAERLDQPELRGMLSMTGGIAAYLQGRFVEAAEGTARAERLLRGPSAAWDRVNALLWGIQAEVYRGHLAAVGERLPGLLRDAERRGDIYLQASLWTCPSRLWWLAADRPDEAVAGVGAAIERWSTRGYQVQHYWQLCALAEIDLYRGDAGAALSRVSRQWHRLRKLTRIQFVAIEASFLRGRVALACGLTPALRRQVVRDARRIEREGAAWGLGLAALLRGALALSGGDRRGAGHRLAEAIAGFEAADMDLYAAVARHRRGEVIGGEAGEAQRTIARTWLQGQGVRNLERLLGALAPGFDSAS